MADSTRLGLPYLAAAQAQKHVTHNEALLRLDGLVQLAVLERGRKAPPDPPAEGDRYLVGADATGAFAGQAGRVAFFDDGAWRFFDPRAGWLLLVLSERTLLWFDGSGWQDIAALLRGLDGLARLGVGTAADAGNPLAAKLNDALFTARGTGEGGSGDLRLKLNKESAARVLSQLFQTGYSGRAETGLVGDDRYRIRVSADGATWRDALVADPATGAVSFPGGIDTIAGGAPAGFRNRLLNGDFAVAQRGAGPFRLTGPGRAYGVDAWQLRAEAAASLVLDRRSAAGEQTPAVPGRWIATLSASGAATGARAGLEARLEDVSEIAGRTVSISFWYRATAPGFAVEVAQHFGDGGSPPALAFSGPSLAAGAGWQRYAVSFAMPSMAGKAVGSGSFTALRILASAGAGSIDLAAVQFEEGPIATVFEVRPLAFELMAARRYFRRYATDRSPADLAFAMRATPARSGTGPFDFSAEL